MKQLKDMTLEELWQLFPIIIEPHNPKWLTWAKEERHLLQTLLNDFHPVITHIGSTAIPEIQAKPIVDLLVEVSPATDKFDIKTVLETSGYICMSESTDRMCFNKGYTPHGFADRVFHIHLRTIGDNAEIAFRDYMTAHAEAAKEYETLKLSLLPRFRHDRDAYTAAKSPFIKKIAAMQTSKESTLPK